MSLAISAAGLTIEPLPSSELAIRLCSPTRNRGALRLTLARGVEARAFRETSLEAAEVDRLAVAERDMEVEREGGARSHDGDQEGDHREERVQLSARNSQVWGKYLRGRSV